MMTLDESFGLQWGLFSEYSNFHDVLLAICEQFDTDGRRIYPPADAGELFVGKSCSEITNLGVPLDPRMVLLARKMDLFALLHDDSHWSSEEKWNLVFPKGLYSFSTSLPKHNKK